MTTLEVTSTDPQETLPGFTPEEWLPDDVPTVLPEPTEKEQRIAYLNTLATQAQHGDVVAFGTLYKETCGELESFLAKRTNYETARDIAQTTFLKAFEKLGSFSGGNVKSWLYTIAIRTYIDSLRKSKRFTLFDAESALTDQPSPVDVEAVVVSRAVAHELFTRSDLPESQKQAIWFARGMGLSFREVAQEQGIPEATARTRTFRAEAYLRERYPVA